MPVLDKKREIFRDIQVKREGYSSKKRGIVRGMQTMIRAMTYIIATQAY